MTNKASRLPWSGNSLRALTGDLYEVQNLSTIVWVTYVNGTALPGWRPTREGAIAVAEEHIAARAPKPLSPAAERDDRAEVENAQPDAAKVEKALYALRSGWDDMKPLFLNGQCVTLYLMLRALFPQAKAWYSELEGHVYTEIDGKFFDIRGRHSILPNDLTPLDWQGEGDPPHRWSRRDRRLLVDRDALRALTAERDRLKARVEEQRQKQVGIGMAVAAGIIMKCWGKEVLAGEILTAAGFHTIEDLKECGVDEYDISLVKSALRPRAARQALKGEDA